jgi:hypothetical protein
MHAWDGEVWAVWGRLLSNSAERHDAVMRESGKFHSGPVRSGLGAAQVPSGTTSGRLRRDRKTV